MTPLVFEYPVSVAVLAYATCGKDGEDTRQTVDSIVAALESRGHVVRVEEVKQNKWMASLRTPGDVVFNLVEDESWDLYYKVGYKLTQMGRPVVGMDSESLPYCVDKTKVVKRLAAWGVRIPRNRIIRRADKIAGLRSLGYPLIVKPSGEHSGWGISQDSVVIDDGELKDRVMYLREKFSGDVIAEEFVEGREIHATVIGNGRHLAVLPCIEVEFSGEFADNWWVYSYEAKWDERSWEYWNSKERVVLKLERALDKAIQKAAKKAFLAANCRDIARIDLRLDQKNRPLVIDVNASPSMNPLKDSPSVKSAMALGWSYEDLVETLVVICYKRGYRTLPNRLRSRQLLLGMPRMVG